jgi:hypothetical protein
VTFTFIHDSAVFCMAFRALSRARGLQPTPNMSRAAVLALGLMMLASIGCTPVVREDVSAESGCSLERSSAGAAARGFGFLAFATAIGVLERRRRTALEGDKACNPGASV